MATAETPGVVAIVEDDEWMRSALQGLMKSAGLRARAFASAEELLDSGELGRTACLVVDIRLPGISGLDLQRLLAAGNQRIPTIFITAHGDETIRARALMEGAFLFLCKPFDDHALVDGIRAAIGKLNSQIAE